MLTTQFHPRRLLTMASILVAAILLTALLAAAATTQPATEEASLAVTVPKAAPPKTVNPHWNAAGCVTCHPTSQGKPRAIATGAVDALCLSCHDGEHAAAEIHPIARAASNKVPVPQAWPLVEGRIGCLTCHDVKQGCGKVTERPSSNSAFLRLASEDTPVGAFCVNCHQPERSPKFNPHLVMDANRQVQAERCGYCHNGPMETNTMKRTGNQNLRQSQLLLCRSCHPQHHEIAKSSHIGLKVKDDTLAFIRAREIVGLLNSPSDELVKQLRESKARPQFMLPAADGTLICTTCHNPHQAGTFPADSALSYRPMRAVNGRTVSPVRGEQFCHHCHAF